MKEKKFILIDVQDSELDDTKNVEIEEPEITACELFGTPIPPTIQTMKVSRYMKNCHVTILIDSSSSHNFVDVGLVKRLKWVIDKGHLFNVKIVDNGKVATHGTLARVPITIQEFNCILDLYAISLGGCDVVLGVRWLRTLGPKLWDFDKFYMQFTKECQTFCINSPDSGVDQIQDISAARNNN